MKSLIEAKEKLFSSSLPSRERGLKYNLRFDGAFIVYVAPFAGAWIEIPEEGALDESAIVAPFAGAWIEIEMLYAMGAISSVAPFAGAWIEITQRNCIGIIGYVAPFAGAWIEIFIEVVLPNGARTSLPSRERGLK